MGAPHLSSALGPAEWGSSPAYAYLDTKTERCRAAAKKQGCIHGIISRVLLGRGSNIIDASSAETTFLC